MSHSDRYSGPSRAGWIYLSIYAMCLSDLLSSSVFEVPGYIMEPVDEPIRPKTVLIFPFQPPRDAMGCQKMGQKRLSYLQVCTRPNEDLFGDLQGRLGRGSQAPEIDEGRSRLLSLVLCTGLYSS